jgi:amidase
MLHDHHNFTRSAEVVTSALPGVSLAPVQHADILELGACALSDLIASREVSCAEVAEIYLDHIERTNPSYNAIVSMRGREEIVAEAREKDALLARGIRQGWLHGTPQAIKDLASTKGLRTTLGSPLHRDSIPTRDASFVQRMKQSGAVVVGKTNTAEFGLGSQTYNPVFGATLNAYNRSLTSGMNGRIEMKSASNSIMHSAAAGASRPAKRHRLSWVRALLDALHESRRRQANKIIHDHSHLLAKPEQIAGLVKSTVEEQHDVD